MPGRQHLATAVLFAVALAACSDARGSSTTGQQSPRIPTEPSVGSMGATHAMQHADQLQWGPAPPIFPAGAEFAVVQGDPSVPGEIFTVRLRFPNNYVLPPHWHPTDEHVTVLRGTFLVGIGETYDPATMEALKVDDFVTAPARVAHYAAARGITEVQVHAIGPFQLTYVNPADDPTRK